MNYNEIKIKVQDGETKFAYEKRNLEPIAIMLAAIDLLEKLHGKVDIYINDEKQEWLSRQDPKR